MQDVISLGYFLFFVLFAFSIPVFYIYGIYKFFNRGKPRPTQEPDQRSNDENKQVGARIMVESMYRQFLIASDNADSEADRTAYQAAANFILNKYSRLLPESLVTAASGVQADPSESFPIEVASEILGHPASIASMRAPAMTADEELFSEDLPPQPALSPFQLLENINILLYLGAFFVIVASGIFASYSYESLSGVMQTVLLGLFAAVFYGSGLVMYQRSETIRPAATVFTAIGLLVAPLVGVVAYYFWFESQEAQIIWFATSLICVALYFIAYRVIRHSLLEYFSIFTALSLFQSTIGLFNLSVPYYYWGFSVFALISMLIEKRVNRRVKSSPLQITAQVLIPLSVFLSLTGVYQTYFHASVTLALATLYYGLLARLSERDNERERYSLVSGLALPVAVILFLMESAPGFSSPTIQVGVLAVAILYTVLTEYFLRKQRSNLAMIFAGLACVLALIACGIAAQNHLLTLFVVITSIAVNLFHLYRLRKPGFYISYAIALFFLPPAVSALLPALGQGVFPSALYLGLLVAFIATRKLALSLSYGLPILVLSYVSAWLMALYAALISDESSRELMVLVINLVVIGLSFWDLRQLRTRAFYGTFVIGLFFLPLTITAFMPSLGSELFLSVVYLLLVGVFLIIRNLILSLKQGAILLISSYGLFCLLAVTLAAIVNEPAAILMILAVAAVVFALTVYEKRPQITFIPLALVYFAILRTSDLSFATDFITSALTSATGVIFFALSYLAPADRKNQLAALGIAGPFLSLFLPYGKPELNPLYSLSGAIGGGMIVIEGVKRRTPWLYKMGVAVILAAVHYFSYRVLNITEIQFYTLSWAAYIFWLSRLAKESEEDFYLVGVLGLITIPLAAQALQDQTRGLVLIGVSLALVIVGIQFRRKLVWRWGVAVLVLEVLYYMRDFFLNLPTWAIFGAVGLALLVGSIVLLQKRTQNR
jgi:hypothetical protein